MKTLVLSGINLFEGGPLSIYYDCLDTLLELDVDNKYDIIAFVHKVNLFEKYVDRVQLIELPDSRDGYFNRLKYEYMYFYRFSLDKNIDIWISLHDITPRVRAGKVYTYCHNPTPFMRKDLSKIKYSVTNVAFSYFYKYLYRINIKNADAIIVQQDWMRSEFLKMYPIKNVIVARPNVKNHIKYRSYEHKNKNKIFMFASFPRYFKNFEVICEACKLLTVDDYEVWLTLDGTENSYAKDLRRKYGFIPNIQWMGLQTREKVFEMYSQVDCLIFPSIIETWGLPISEFKITGKQMILADLSYSHETLGTYEKVLFFNPIDSRQLSEKMEMVIFDSPIYDSQREVMVKDPYAKDWCALIKMIINFSG